MTIKECFEKLIERGIISKDELQKSTVTYDDIKELEDEYKIKLPEIFKEYLITYSYDFTTLLGVVYQYYGELSEQYIEIINIPKDNPLSSFKEYIEGIIDMSAEFDDEDKFLAQGYIPFGDWGAGWGPVCFDTNKKECDVDFDDTDTWTIVWFDHEEILDGGELKDLATPATPTFTELIEWYFAGKLQEKYDEEE